MDQFLSKKLRRAGTRREQRIVEKYKAIWRIESLSRIGNSKRKGRVHLLVGFGQNAARFVDIMPRSNRIAPGGMVHRVLNRRLI